MILFYPFLAFLAPPGRFKAGESAGNYIFCMETRERSQVWRGAHMKQCTDLVAGSTESDENNFPPRFPSFSVVLDARNGFYAQFCIFLHNTIFFIG